MQVEDDGGDGAEDEEPGTQLWVAVFGPVAGWVALAANEATSLARPRAASASVWAVEAGTYAVTVEAKASKAAEAAGSEKCMMK